MMEAIEAKVDIILSEVQAIRSEIKDMDCRVRGLEQHRACQNGAKREREALLAEQDLDAQKGMYRWAGVSGIISVAAVLGGISAEVCRFLIGWITK